MQKYPGLELLMRWRKSLIETRTSLSEQLNHVLRVFGRMTVLIVFGSTPFSPYRYNFTRSDPAYINRKHKRWLYSLHSFNQLIQMILIIFLFFGQKSNLFLPLRRCYQCHSGVYNVVEVISNGPNK